MSARKYPLNEIVSLLVRNRWLILIPLAIGAALAPVLARYAPERYRSDALIVVIPQQVPDSYVKATVSESVSERLPSITDTILSRPRLQLIIEQMGLYPAERSRWVMQDVVERMRNDITTTPVGREVNSFRISYASDTAETAHKVTERLSSLYVEQNSQERTNQADQTSEFFDRQLDQAKTRLIEQEKRLEEYRMSHAGEMPSQMQGNLQAIQNANLQLQSLNESTNRAQERRLLIERQIADAEALAVPAAPPPAVGPDAAVGMTTAQQLDLAKTRLTNVLQRYTPDHPDVRTLERMVDELARRLESEVPVTAAEAVAAPPLTPAEAARLKRTREFEAELAVLDYQLAANLTESGRLKQTIAEYQAKVDAVPTRESELVELTRDYGTMQAAYASLLMKREDAMIAANMERRQISEQFRTIEPASLPQRPENQLQRLAITASGAAAGLVFGVLLVGLLEYRNSSFRSAEEVLQALSIPVLASIPVMVSERERQAARRRGWLMDAGGTALLVAAGAVLVFWRLQA